MHTTPFPIFFFSSSSLVFLSLLFLVSTLYQALILSIFFIFFLKPRLIDVILGCLKEKYGLKTMLFCLDFFKTSSERCPFGQRRREKKKEKKSWLGTPWKCLVLGSRCAPFAPKPHLCE